MSQLKSRMNVINLLYAKELLKEEIDWNCDCRDLSEPELKALKWIVNKYDLLKKLIMRYIKTNWEWNRISPLERSMLLYGAFELSFRNKKIVINEMVILCKGYIPGDSYKFINAVLDKVSKYYENSK